MKERQKWRKRQKKKSMSWEIGNLDLIQLIGRDSNVIVYDRKLTFGVIMRCWQQSVVF